MTSEVSGDAVVEQTPPPTILCVDDEANILSALKRLFRGEGYRILTAGGGKEGLTLLEQERVDLVISDMRMPEMNGAQFLEQVRARWPDTMRLLLTGYAEISATVDAINKGGIYRYISKPWEDEDMRRTVREALERLQLEREKRRLEALTQRQNEELRTLNASLEEKVQARTAELRGAMQSLTEAHEKLKKGFITSVRVFSNLIELRGGTMSGHSRRVAEVARGMARQLGLSEADVQDVFLAALLHDIGKIGLPDKLLDKPFTSLTSEERAEVVKHPVKGQAALMALEQLQGAAKLIRGHHERFDGMGYPEGLAGLTIPLGARILAVANDFDAVQQGMLLPKRLAETQAIEFIREGRGKRYDPAVVDAFLKIRGVPETAAAPTGDGEVHTGQLVPGMVLARDLVSPDGVMLLAREYILDESLIEQIRAFERADGRIFAVHVRMKGG